MNLTVSHFKDKAVICAKTGNKIGSVCDLEFDACTGKITFVFVYGKQKGINPFCRVEPYKIPWSDIQVIGEDSILIGRECKEPAKKKPVFEGLFR